MTRVEAAALGVLACLALVAVGTAGATLDANATGQTANVTATVDCGNGTVTFAAPNETTYVASVTVVSVSPTRVSSARETRTVRGNATFNASTSDVVAAFASPGTLGDETTVSKVALCRSRTAGNATGTAC